MNSGELKVDVPLAATEESDCDDGSSDNQSHTPKRGTNHLPSLPKSTPPNLTSTPKRLDPNQKNDTTARKASPRFNIDTGGDSVTGSLEDLVSSFDEKITLCFRDYQEQVDKIAPVQVRSQEEIMNECQVWWTLTGNFGNMMPIDWSKSTARAKQLETLNLCNPKAMHPATRGGNKVTHGRPGAGPCAGSGDELTDEDDMVAADLDMHSLILTSNSHEQSEPVKSADEVIKEIDEIIDAADEDDFEGGPSLMSDDPAQIGDTQGSNLASDSSTNAQNVASYLPNLPLSSRRLLSQALRGRNLEDLNLNELSQILNDIELLIKDLSEELVSDLGIRDELEYEKELKNTFISLLLSIQSRRRACSTDSGGTHSSSNSGGRNSFVGRAGLSRHVKDIGGGSTNIPQYKYLTTVIPYQPEKGAPSLHGLQVLVKILKAINEDSPAVPALLTDYILKVLCPS